MKIYQVKASLVEDTFKWDTELLAEAIRDVLNKVPGLVLFKLSVTSSGEAPNGERN